MNDLRSKPKSVERFLQELEVAAKQGMGVHPNRILRDAEEHLTRDYESLKRSEPGISEEEILEHFRVTFGQPTEIVENYESFSEAPSIEVPAVASNWRLHCKCCGRSAPAEKVGITRIAARSWGKRVLGWCRECHRFRWLSLTQDLQSIGTVEAGEFVTKPNDGPGLLEWIRRCMGFSVWTMVLSMLLLVASQGAAQQPVRNSKAPGLERLPQGWTLVRETEVSRPQLNTFSKKLGTPIASVFNTVLRYQEKELQINTLVAKSSSDAEKLKATLQKGKSNPRWVAQSNTRVYEFVVQKQEQARLACHARSELALLSPSMAYTVALDAIPIQSEAIGSEPDVRNRLFNLLIQRTSDTTPLPEALALARNFQVASKFTLIRDLQGAVTIRWASPQAEVVSSQGDTEQIEWKVVAPKQVWGMPVVPFTAEIAIDQRKVRNVSPDGKGESLLAASPRFPVDDGELRRVVGSVLSQADSDAVKLRKLLDWFADTKNMRYEGRVGSRYGTLVAFQQHHGRCWDYSDLFITMARIAGLPCRQVYGWLHESEGHVWCDVVVDGKWLMIDPTAAAPCDVGYLPFSLSDTGEFPMLYASQVSIQQTGVGSPFRGD